MVEKLNQKDVFIDSLDMLGERLSLDNGVKVKKRKLIGVVKEDLGMRFKKVHPVSFHANSEKNLVLRQRFAMVMLDALFAGKVILNIDETWLGMTDFRCRKWCPRDSKNSVAKLQMQPRVSMICGLDTTGRVYLSLL